MSERVFRHDVAAGVTGRMADDYKRLDGYGRVVEEGRFDSADEKENMGTSKADGDVLPVIADTRARQKNAWKTGKKWDAARARRDTGKYEPPAASAQATAFTESALDEVAAAAEKLGVRNAKELLRGGLARPEIDPGGPLKNSEQPRIAPEPSESDEKAMAWAGVDPDDVGRGDAVAEAQQRMQTRNANAWKTRRKAGR